MKHLRLRRVADLLEQLQYGRGTTNIRAINPSLHGGGLSGPPEHFWLASSQEKTFGDVLTCGILKLASLA